MARAMPGRAAFPAIYSDPGFWARSRRNRQSTRFMCAMIDGRFLYD
jgi:hypothetical protein